MSNWSVQDAKAKFSALLDACLVQGPQIMTRRGAEVAVMASLEEWRRMQAGQRSYAKDVLLMEGARTDDLVPSRGRLRRRVVAAD